MEQATLPCVKEEERLPQTYASVISADRLASNAASCEPSRLYYISKRVFDIVFSLLGIVVLTPLILGIAVCIKLNDGGKVFYIREMVGLRGRHFAMFKFRTMIQDADTFLEKHPELLRKFQENMKLMDDPRITRLGRFLRKVNLDELPQLINVLAGQMSLVGPRTVPSDVLSRFGQYARKRLTVKPGITGSWQISPDRFRDYGERIRLDMDYIDHRSFVVDLLILLKTLKVFFVHTGI